mgnify:CR=1 FL=1
MRPPEYTYSYNTKSGDCDDGEDRTSTEPPDNTDDDFDDIYYDNCNDHESGGNLVYDNYDDNFDDDGEEEDEDFDRIPVGSGIRGHNLYLTDSEESSTDYEYLR